MSKNTDAPEQVTVLVFKENLAARTFHLPLAWLNRLGVLLGIGLGVVILTSSLAVKYFRIAHEASPSRVRDLELEVTELKNTLTLRTAPSPKPSIVAERPNTPASNSPATQESGGLTFSQRPLLLSEAPPKPESLPIKLAPLTLSWRGKQLAIRSSIQYVAEGGGKQNGRILVIAYGPKTLMTYPDGLLNPAHTESLLDPTRGETFSVSRFREISATLGPIENRAQIETVQLILLDEDGKILTTEEAKISSAKNSAPGKETHGPAF